MLQQFRHHLQRHAVLSTLFDVSAVVWRTSDTLLHFEANFQMLLLRCAIDSPQQLIQNVAPL